MFSSMTITQLVDLGTQEKSIDWSKYDWLINTTNSLENNPMTKLEI
jgi:hypothetical protein